MASLGVMSNELGLIAIRGPKSPNAILVFMVCLDYLGDLVLLAFPDDLELPLPPADPGGQALPVHLGCPARPGYQGDPPDPAGLPLLYL